MSAPAFPVTFIADIERAVLARDGQPNQGEILFRCPLPGHPDTYPSARYHPKKLTYFCDVCKQGGGVLDLADRLGVPRPETIHQNGHGSRIVATYDYRDEHGALLYQTVRHHPKRFNQRRPDGSNGWVWSIKTVRLVPYRLQELLASTEEFVFVCEGEKDVENLRALGLTATTTAMGAGKWRPHYATHFRGKNVVLLPDNDDPGRAHMATAAASLSRVARSVRVVALPDLPEKGDVSAWLAGGGTADALMALVEETPEQGGQKAGGPKLVIRQMSTVTPQAIDWIWVRWLARRKLHILGGVGGIGKGTIMAALAAQLSTGKGTLPDGTPAPLVKSLFLLSEDAPDDTFWPRLDVHGADKSNVYVVEAVEHPDDTTGMLNLGKHIALLEGAIAEHGIGLVVVDSLSDYLSGVDRNSEGEVRDILTPLGQMAQRTDAAIVGVMHPAKGHAELKAFQRLLGASAFGNVARCVWLAAESPDGDGRNLLGVDKSNLSVKPPTLAWSRAEDAPICWHGQSDHTIGEVFGSSTATPRDDAEGFLMELLKGGSVAATRVQSLAKAAGLSWATVRRAADALRVEKYRPAGQKNPPWLWKLPNGPTGDDPPPETRVDDVLTDRDGEQLEHMDDLLTPKDAQVSNSSSRQQPPRVAHDGDSWATREKPHASGKVLTNDDGEPVVRDRAEELPTSGRVDELLTRETQGVSNSSEPPTDGDDPPAPGNDSFDAHPPSNESNTGSDAPADPPTADDGIDSFDASLLKGKRNASTPDGDVAAGDHVDAVDDEAMPWDDPDWDDDDEFDDNPEPDADEIVDDVFP